MKEATEVIWSNRPLNQQQAMVFDAATEDLA